MRAARGHVVRSKDATGRRLAQIGAGMTFSVQRRPATHVAVPDPPKPSSPGPARSQWHAFASQKLGPYDHDLQGIYRPKVDR